MSEDKIYSLDDKITFGKYKGEIIEDIIDHDVSYIEYLIEEQAIELDNETYEYYQNKLK